MTRLIPILLTALVLCCVPLQNAAAKGEIEKGDFEISFAVDLTQQDDIGDSDGATNLTTNANVGYYITPHNYVNLDVTYFNSDSGDVDFTLATYAGRYDFHFNPSSLAIFYLGASAGLQVFESGDFDDSEIAYQGQAGVKFGLLENAFIKLEGSAVNYEIETGSGDETLTDLRLLFAVGFRF